MLVIELFNNNNVSINDYLCKAYSRTQISASEAIAGHFSSLQKQLQISYINFRTHSSYKAVSYYCTAMYPT